MFLIAVLGFMSFSAATVLRLADPVVPLISRDFGVSLEAAALVASAFALPYALGQLVLGPLGDALGKTRVIKFCLGSSLVALAVCVVAPSYPALFAGRFLGGLAAGGILPIAIAMIGDRYEFAERQVALSRLLLTTVTGQLAGSIVGGAIGESFGWRVPFAIALALNVAGFLLSLAYLRPLSAVVRKPVSLAGIKAGYGRVLANPKAVVCFSGVFAEGVFIYGIFPHLAGILEMRGVGGVYEAGYIIAAFGLGGLVYAGVIKLLLRRLDLFGVLRFGGILGGLSLLAFVFVEDWRIALGLFLLLGLGFYSMHSSFQTQATELAPDARGSAVALHAFSYFMGIALGPAIFAAGMIALGLPATLFICAAGTAATGLAGAYAMIRRSRA